MPIKDQRKAIILGLLAVLLWSTVATAFKIALQYLTPMQLLLLASMVTVGFLTLVISVQRRWREALELAQRRGWRYLVFGLINPCAYYWALFSAYDVLPAQQAQAINYSWALTTTLLAVPILKQPLRRQEILALAIAYAGVVLIATGGQWDLAKTHWGGVGMALLSTVLWAFYWLFSARNDDPPILALWLAFTASLPFLWGLQWFTDATWQWQWQSFAAGLYVGLFEMGVTFLLWLYAMRYAERTAPLSTLIFLSPFLSLILIASLLNETIQSTTVIGLIAICCGLLLQRRRRV
ncbi:DMT family transporter [Idiomarina tyrosinivorans]|uniref:DMT family transporter n=1 Tax=Idiomarina tyrosinivorans TaxID=1445662 RepID=UPI001F54348A|nr:DMT family transporter [Idiomarina tyrosinivorans]